ncbi:hypothetical protein F5984_13365 [Rudanella paleaurantiibacter]|uniref:DUF5672 domain-containing protein n=1 Tax=Rudanella paleaurantiibacter TaxID=2614655 RepID=A0A7J5TYH6_9BACT|nr:DUF5672 family protein [Rudanella paleaurantiibacter]KAB7730164.1 hypothetical protein F5984_13365 [Rudanella paleaurantiibacter]
MTKKAPTSSLVGVVVPVYKPQLSPYERIALTQCTRVLGHYPIWLVCPQTLDVSAITAEFPKLQVVRFADSFFESVQSYNQLMLSKSFYEAFFAYEYILIHQLDAFVFRDELTDWCRRNYDYIGAPWLRDIDFSGRLDEFIFDTKKQIATWLNLKKADGITPREIITLNEVGNGGFSLRRVKAMHACLQRFERTIQEYEAHSLHQYNEDVFFSIEVNRYWPHLRIPNFRTGLRFAVEFYPERAVRDYNGGQLPFGCHAWDIHGTDYWRLLFAQLGYQI